MTGRDLIIYILENNLEDKIMFEDGKIPGFMTVSEAAVKFKVGAATVNLWVKLGSIQHTYIGDTIYIPCNAERPKNNTVYVLDRDIF